MSNVSVCLHDESSWVQRNEVFRINLEDVAVSALYSDNLQTHIELNLSDIQIDNQMADDFYHFPVVLLPLENESRSTKRKEKRTLKPLLNCCLDFSMNKQKTHVHLLSLQLEPLSVFIEDTFLYRLAGMLDSFILPESDRPAQPFGRYSDENIPTVSEDQATTHDHFRSETERKSTRSDNTRSCSERNTTSDKDIRDLSLASAIVSPVLIDRISIEPVYVLVTFHASVKLFVSANHTPLFFSRFEMTSLFTDPAFLAQLLAVHYAYSALMKVGWIVGSLDIIGSPASFIRSLGQGIADFFYLPYDGLTRGPTAFVTGMTRGMSSFMSHISAGALTSVTNLASSISRNMDRLSFDEQYVRFQEQQRADGAPRRVISGELINNYSPQCRWIVQGMCAMMFYELSKRPLKHGLFCHSGSLSRIILKLFVKNIYVRNGSCIKSVMHVINYVSKAYGKKSKLWRSRVRLDSKSSLALKEWRFNLSFP